MKKQLKAEAHILDRIMYLLEEGSVTYTMAQDRDFAKYIDRLYSSLYVKADNIRNCATKTAPDDMLVAALTT